MNTRLCLFQKLYSLRVAKILKRVNIEYKLQHFKRPQFCFVAESGHSATCWNMGLCPELYFLCSVLTCCPYQISKDSEKVFHFFPPFLKRQTPHLVFSNILLPLHPPTPKHPFWSTSFFCLCCQSQVSLMGKESVCHCKRHKKLMFDPWVGKGMATDSSILSWRIPWTEEPGRPQSIGSQRVGHNWSDLALRYANHSTPSFCEYTCEPALDTQVPQPNGHNDCVTSLSPIRTVYRQVKLSISFRLRKLS